MHALVHTGAPAAVLLTGAASIWSAAPVTGLAVVQVPVPAGVTLPRQKWCYVVGTPQPPRVSP